MEMHHPGITLREGQMTGIEALQADGLLLLVRNLCPCFNHITTCVGLIKHLHRDGILFVGHGDASHSAVAFLSGGNIVNGRVEYQLSVVMNHLQCG